MFYDTSAKAKGEQVALQHNPFKALVAPRAIGWITTLTEDGTVNLAPYSYFQAVADNPDIVMFSAASGMRMVDGKLTLTQERKHSEHNAGVGGEFVCNIVTYELREPMNLSSAHLPAADSEADHAELALTPSTYVKPPRVAAAPAALECVVVDTRPVRHRGGDHSYHMVFGEVLAIHIDDTYINNGQVDTGAMKILTRLGYDEYGVLEQSFRMARPDFDPLLSGALK